MGLWGTLALWYFDDANLMVRAALCAIFAVASLAALVALGWRRWRWRITGAYLCLFALLLVCWTALKPSNDRDWQTDVAILPYATRQR